MIDLAGAVQFDDITMMCRKTIEKNNTTRCAAA